MGACLYFKIEGKPLSLPVEELERVFPALAVQPLPSAEGRFYAFFNFAGDLIPVFNMASAPAGTRPGVLPSQPLILVRYNARHFAFFADSLSGVSEENGSNADRLNIPALLTAREDAFVRQFGKKVAR